MTVVLLSMSTHAQINVLLQLIQLVFHLSVARVCLEIAFEQDPVCILDPAFSSRFIPGPQSAIYT